MTSSPPLGGLFACLPTGSRALPTFSLVFTLQQVKATAEFKQPSQDTCTGNLHQYPSCSQEVKLRNHLHGFPVLEIPYPSHFHTHLAAQLCPITGQSLKDFEISPECITALLWHESLQGTLPSSPDWDGSIPAHTLPLPEQTDPAESATGKGHPQNPPGSQCSLLLTAPLAARVCHNNGFQARTHPGSTSPGALNQSK